MKKAILWDLDGTLLYTLEDLWYSTNVALREFGLPERTLLEVRRLVGNGAAMQMRRAAGGEPPFFQELLDFYKDYYIHHSNERTKPYDGMLEVVEKLQSQGWKLGIVSNKPDPAVNDLRDIYFPSFPVAQGETAEIPRKPAPQMLFKSLEKLGVTPEEAIYVGDSEVDIETANNAGIPCISALWGYRDREDLLCAGGKWLCETPKDIFKVLEEICHV